jgi:hypothetical protein
VSPLVRRLFAVTAGLALTASAVAPPIQNNLQNVTQALPGQSLVVGSIQYSKNGSTSDCGDLLASLGGCNLIVISLDDDRAMVFKFRHSQEFLWSLPPGEYLIKSLDRNNDVQEVSLRFDVPSGVPSVYVGTLHLNIHDGILGTEVRDEYIRKAMDDNVTKNLMRDEGNLGHVEDVMPLCSGEWGLPCSLRKQGVSPILPNKSRGPFAEGFAAKDLRPIIQWTPSTRKDVTYDLALYRGVYFHGVPFRGRLVSYQEGLTQLTWQPESALESGRTYFWSVRVRSGQTVSNWSTYTAEYTSGLFGPTWLTNGEWFRFDTLSSP